MKSKVLEYSLIMLILITTSLSVNGQIKKVFRGNWNFEAPTGNTGFTDGIIEFKKDSVFTIFANMRYKFPCTWVKVKRDSIIFVSNINGYDVLSSLKIENKTSMTGICVWHSGESKLILQKK
jgi:hypothetical protein